MVKTSSKGTFIRIDWSEDNGQVITAWTKMNNSKYKVGQEIDLIVHSMSSGWINQ